ncbi:hypothetical protein GBAR_LOCUS13915 [Geodia barretti]|uniref:Uncharacterized protein n=1 Tax=Geodia barretti TaxID=519541 RepID=A0AA35WKL5_GEOBA|nr:hypothetical protein GBAR_LOCUS13915 [Geodia barretti]
MAGWNNVNNRWLFCCSWRVQLLAVLWCMCCFNIAQAVHLTALGIYSTNATVTLCRNYNFTIVFECKASSPTYLQWSSSQLMESKSFLAANENGSFKLDGEFMFYLISVIPSNNGNRYFISQLQVPTTYFIDNDINHTTVTCKTSDDADGQTWAIKFSVVGGVLSNVLILIFTFTVVTWCYAC